MNLQENTVDDDRRIIHGLLNQIEVAKNVPEKLWIINTIYRYLTQHPLLIQNYRRFRIAVKKKMREMFAVTHRYKVAADPEGGKINQPLLTVANTLQKTMKQLKKQMKQQM